MQKLLITTCLCMGFYLLDAQPIVQWEKLYGGSGDDFIRHIHATPDGGCITAGTSTSTDGDVGVNFGNADAWIMKLDQDGLLEWKKVLGGNKYDTGQCIFNTSDGNYIFLGATRSSNGGAIEIKGKEDFWIVKLDLSGNILWQKTYGGSEFDLLRKGKPTSDGGFIALGISDSNDGDVSGHHGTVNFSDVWVGKFDSLGQLEWQQSLGGMDEDQGNDISLTQDGGYVITAYILSPDIPGFHGESEGWVIKLNSDGEVEWQRTLGGSLSDGLDAVEATSTRGYLVTGYSRSEDGEATVREALSNELMAYKLDGDGKIEWSKAFGGLGSENGRGILASNEGGFILVGEATSFSSDRESAVDSFDFWLIGIDNLGTLIWETSIGANTENQFRGIARTQDTGILVGGVIWQNNSYQVTLFKLLEQE